MHLSDEQKIEISAILDSHKLPESFELGSPEFCTFESMMSFESKFSLT